MAHHAKFSGIKGGQSDMRDMLVALGAGNMLATMAIPYMMFLVSSSDPDAQGVQVIVKGLQRGLNKLGFKLGVDGFLGRETASALRRVAGTNWPSKTWVQLYGDVLSATPMPKRKRKSPNSLGHYEQTGASFVGDLLASSVGVGLFVFGAYWFFIKKGKQS